MDPTNRPAEAPLEGIPAPITPDRTGVTAPADSLPTGSRVRWDQLQQQYRSLEMMFALTVSALILLSMGLNLFLFKQMRLARGQAQQQGELIRRTAKEFHATREPVIRSFILSLQEFSATDPDCKALLEKYRPSLGKYFNP